jgi:hypothetical protein
MKKVVFLCAVLLLMGGSMFAQKKNVSKAKVKMGAEVPDLKGAKEAILPALSDTITNKLASTWFLAAEILKANYDNETKKTPMDKALMATTADDAIRYYIVADSLDQLPNKKGKIKPKYHEKAVEKLKEFQKAHIVSGSYFLDQKNFSKALEYFSKYLDYANYPIMKGLGLEKDTLRPIIYYHCGISATQAEMPAVASKYYEVIKDSLYSSFCYARLSKDYTALKDSANMLRILKAGFQKFPKEPYYVQSLINYFIEQSKLHEATTWINEALAQDSKNAQIWNLKGRIIESDSVEVAKACYLKAIELDPSLSEPLGNIGRIYYNFAVDELSRVNAIRDNKKYAAEKAKLKKTFEIPLPYFEKAYALDPQVKDFMIALRGIYYNIGNDAKYQEMDKKLSNF